MTESQEKTKLVRWFNERGHYARRIEDKFAVGIPDLFIAPRGLPMFVIEAKLVKNRGFHARDRQYVELDRIRKAHCVVVPAMLGFLGDELYIHPPHLGRIKITACMHDNEPLRLLTRYYHDRSKEYSSQTYY